MVGHVTPLSPEAIQVLEAAPDRPRRHTVTVAENREAFRRQIEVFGPGADVWKVEETRVPCRDGKVPVRIYRTEPRHQPALVYAHGGGWALGDLDTHDALCRELAAGADCAVISVDYRQPPEYPFPYAVQDVVDALNSVVAMADELDIDPTRVAIGGDSAGGNLAAVAAQQSRHQLYPVHQLLIMPAVDTDTEGWPSYREFADGYSLTRNDMLWYFEQYFGGAEVHPADTALAPLRCPDLHGLAPATVITAECDPLRDEGEAYASRLAKAGVAVALRRFQGMFHPFILFGNKLSAAREAQAYAAAQLRLAFAQ